MRSVRRRRISSRAAGYHISPQAEYIILCGFAAEDIIRLPLPSPPGKVAWRLPEAVSCEFAFGKLDRLRTAKSKRGRMRSTSRLLSVRGGSKTSAAFPSGEGGAQRRMRVVRRRRISSRAAGYHSSPQAEYIILGGAAAEDIICFLIPSRIKPPVLLIRLAASYAAIHLPRGGRQDTDSTRERRDEPHQSRLCLDSFP